MTTITAPSAHRSPSALPLVLALLASCTLAAPDPSYAEDGSASSRAERFVSVGAPPAEKTYWACDYAATTRWVGMDEGMMCSENFEQVKATRFKGDFRAMLAWWQKNKAAEHAALAQREGQRPAR
jgi:hypothetical protein